jgi:hypothetical protein
MDNNPLWFKRNIPYHDFGSSTVADSVGNNFQSRYIPQQTSLVTSQYSPSPTYRHLPTMDEQRYGLSHETIVKVEELKRLVQKYPQYQDSDPNVIVEWAIYCYMNGDNKFLDEKLEQLRTIERRLNGWSCNP